MKRLLAMLGMFLFGLLLFAANADKQQQVVVEDGFTLSIDVDAMEVVSTDIVGPVVGEAVYVEESTVTMFTGNTTVEIEFVDDAKDILKKYSVRQQTTTDATHQNRFAPPLKFDKPGRV